MGVNRKTVITRATDHPRSSSMDQNHGNFMADRLEGVPGPGKAKKYEFLKVKDAEHEKTEKKLLF